jgi:endonuclease YncB( thermonuclease family)
MRTLLAMTGTLLALLLGSVFAAAPGGVIAQEWDCSPYDAWEWAQSAYERAQLEAGGDVTGVVCEHLPRGGAAPALWTDAIPERATPAMLARVFDGDTIEGLLINDDGSPSNELVQVRLILTDTPETRDPRKPVQCFGQEATTWTTWLLSLSPTIWLEKDVSETDQFGRLLRYVWIELGSGEVYLVNEAIVRSGYGVLSTYPPDVARVDEIREAEQFARKHELGLWGACGGPGVPLEDIQPGAAPDAPAPSATQTQQDQPSESVAVGLELRALTSPIAASGQAFIQVQTSPGASCSITVTYKSGPSTAQGLEPKQAGANGIVGWSWTVGSGTSPGEWPITIRCDGQTLNTSFQVV